MEPRKPNPQDFFIGTVLIAVAFVVLGFVVYFHLHSPLAMPPAVKRHPVRAASPPPSDFATPVPSASESASPSPSPAASPSLTQSDVSQEEKWRGQQEAKKEERMKEMAQAEERRSLCLKQVEQDRLSEMGKTCRSLYDEYVRECKESDCRTAKGWSQDTILPPYLSCCERDARQKLGINYMGPINPSSTIPTCNLPPDAQASIEANYEAARAACGKIR